MGAQLLLIIILCTLKRSVIQGVNGKYINKMIKIFFFPLIVIIIIIIYLFLVWVCVCILWVGSEMHLMVLYRLRALLFSFPERTTKEKEGEEMRRE